MPDVCFSLAECTINLHSSRPIFITENFLPFLGGEHERSVDITFREAEELPDISGQPLFSNFAFSVFLEGGRLLRRYHDRKENDRPYAIGWREGNRVTVEYLASVSQFFSESQNSFSHIALEELLLSLDRLILHASLVETQWGGLLFSGPPGIGKSTQAMLWEQEEGAVQINGDRPILSRDDGKWMGWGSPYAGSSRCFVNRGVPIRAVVMLDQGPKNVLTRLPLSESFRRLYAQTTVNTWDPDYVQKVCDLLAKLSEEIPVYHLVCTPDTRAVEILRQELRRGGG